MGLASRNRSIDPRSMSLLVLGIEKHFVLPGSLCKMAGVRLALQWAGRGTTAAGMHDMEVLCAFSAFGVRGCDGGISNTLLEAIDRRACLWEGIRENCRRARARGGMSHSFRMLVLADGTAAFTCPK